MKTKNATVVIVLLGFVGIIICTIITSVNFCSIITSGIKLTCEDVVKDCETCHSFNMSYAPSSKIFIPEDEIKEEWVWDYVLLNEDCNRLCD